MSENVTEQIHDDLKDTVFLNRNRLSNDISCRNGSKIRKKRSEIILRTTEDMYFCKDFEI